jgi:hypothetical protein
MTLCEGNNKIFIFITGKNDVLSSIDKNYCPFIETLSFGSDIHIKCNNSYLIFNEITVNIQKKQMLFYLINIYN